MKKLLFVINTLGYGGAERAMLDLFEAIKNESYDISLFVLTGQGELICELPSHIHLLNQNYSDISVLTDEGRKQLIKSVLQAGIGKGLFVRRFGYLIKNLVQMIDQKHVQADKLCWRILADGAPVFPQEYDLAVAYLEGGSTYYVADHVRAKKKVAFVHIDYVQAGYNRSLDQGCYEKFDRIFTVSDEVKESFLKVYPEYQYKVSVFNNLINRSRIEKMSLEGEGYEDHFSGYRILTIGRLAQQKRYDLAIETMKLLKQKTDVPVRWYVLGEGELRNKLEGMIRKYGLQNDFILEGVKTNPFPYYRNCDLYVHATGYEGKSIAIQEAQVLGKAVLATDCTGNREQIRPGIDGRLCALDPDVISDEIVWMIKHPNQCMEYGKQAQKRVLYQSHGLEEMKGMLR